MHRAGEDNVLFRIVNAHLFLPLSPLHRATWSFLTLAFAQDWKKHIGQNFIGIWTTASPVISVSVNSDGNLFIPGRAISPGNQNMQHGVGDSHSSSLSRIKIPSQVCLWFVLYGERRWRPPNVLRQMSQQAFFGALLRKLQGMNKEQANKSSRGKNPGNNSRLDLPLVLSRQKEACELLSLCQTVEEWKWEG